MSAASRANGKPGASSADGDDADAGQPRAKSSRKRFEPVEVMLEHSRWRHLGWALFFVVLGLLLVFKLGTVGKFVGLLLLAIAGYRGFKFGRTLLVPAGIIKVQTEQVALPRGLCRGRPEVFPSEQIRHAYLLRRSVSWTTTGPILVIEVGERAFTYPRDWFLSETDQHRIARAIHLLQHKQAES